jgi:hypothetical protein
MLEVEEWRSIADWPEYAVSNLGRIKRLTSRTCAKAGSILKTPPRSKKNPYPAVDLCSDEKRRTFAVHQLVAAAFLGPCPDGLEVNHKNGDKTEPRASNLEYATSSANQLHAYATGLQSAVGELNGQAILTEEQVMEIRASCRGFFGEQAKLARRYGVTPTCIRDVCQRRTWAHVA